VLLLVPLRIVSRRPVTRGALWPTVLVGATMMGLLGLAAAVSVHAAILGDKPEKPWELPLLAALVSGLWGFWTVVFGRLSRKRPPADFLSVLCRRLMQGSILELLVAVPCHIVVRCRDYCCAGLFTMFGLAMGVSVMLFAFGPAVYFLFVARAKRLEALVPKSDELTGNT
jgi:cation transporter-like permease